MNTMMDLSRLALKHTRSAIAESLYLNGLGDITRPTVVYGLVNERCNYKCRYCDYWRLPAYQDEMSIAEWTEALASLKDFIGVYHVEFSGGEPFIKKDILDLFDFCYEEGLRWGVTTNGSALSEKTVRRVVAARPFNINISMDSHRADVHNYVRGIDGSLTRVMQGIQLLVQERERAGLNFPIIIKPVVHRLNFRTLPEMVNWVPETGASTINFQPVTHWTKETYDELWIEEDDLDELQAIADRLVQMKRTGAPIMNSEVILQHWTNHFRGEKAPASLRPCRVGLRNYFIRTNGDVELCYFYEPIGNVKHQSAREIWAGEEARIRRQETVACDKLCLFTCLSQKSLKDKVEMGLTMIKGTKRPRSPK